MIKRFWKYMAIVPLLIASACFTGVESTPKITAANVKKENIKTTAEQQFLADVGPQPPAQWAQGKQFYVADPKISIIFSSQSSPDKDYLYGKEIAFHSMYPVTSVTGEQVTEIEFVSPSGGRLFYRINTPYSEIADRQILEIPFTIEQDIVNDAKARMVGKLYYAVTPLWYSADGEQSINGLRHVPVEIKQVVPGNAVYPLRVVFKAEGDERLFSMYMTVGTQRNSTRNFDTLFAFDNPRKKYPQISDENWELIKHSRVSQGMSRDECRLALGSPQTIGQRPTTAGMVEYWSYSDGIYLLFEEGYLSYFRR